MTLRGRQSGIWASVVMLLGSGLAYLLLVAKPAPELKLPEQGLPPIVDIVTVRPKVYSPVVETQGTVRPMREISLISQVAGRVESVSDRFEEGEFFGAGEELLRLEGIDYQYAIVRAESQVAAAQQRVAEEKGRALQATREWRDLGNDQANELFLRKPQLASALAALKAAEADLGSARLNLERTSLHVPFNGRISEKYVDLGQYVASGTKIAKVYDTDLAQIRLPLTDLQVASLDIPLNHTERQSVELRPAVVLRARFANSSWEWRGRIVRTDANIDVNSRLVYVVAEVANPFAVEEGSERPPLAPGLFVNAAISGREFSRVSELPRSALRSDGSVMVVGAAQRVRKQPVKVLHSSLDRTWVQGLILGERVIVREGAKTVAGMEVTINYVAQLASGSN